jgi:hypothetical protein
MGVIFKSVPLLGVLRTKVVIPDQRPVPRLQFWGTLKRELTFDLGGVLPVESIVPPPLYWQVTWPPNVAEAVS